MASYMPIYAYADSYDISEGSITVSRDETAQTVTQEGNSAVQDKEDSDPVITSNNQEVSGVTLTIEASSGQEAEVTIQNLNINDSANNFTPAIRTTGEGNVKINLDGVNVVKSGDNCAGLQKENEGDLIITDNNATGSLDATGGSRGAGIGGGRYRNGTDITIEGGTVTATGGEYGAGIGSGIGGSGTDITIKEGGTVTATGGELGAGIGGGVHGSGTDITIKEGGTVTATGGFRGAGIGGGANGSGTDITIEGGTVTATGGSKGAGIGGGDFGSGTGITVSNNAHVMVSGGIYDQYSGAAIGDGVQYDYDTFVTSSGEEVSPDVSLLSSDGYILYYPAGTTANQIKNGSVRPINAVPITAFPSEETTSGEGNTPNEPPVDEGNTINYRNASIVTPNVDEADTQQDEEEITEVISTTHSSSGGSYVDNSEVDSIPTSSEEFAAFLTATNNTLEVYIKKIEAMMAAGDTEGLNALVSKGITLETGNWVCFNKKTYALIEKISDLGVPVTISFAYKGRRYSTVIPGKADIRPLDLCNEEGYCGFLNLIKYYGGGEK
ncbi:hypothetical protein D6853_00975 [Butyrivibrio sp. X503]|nr:hypothetical protein D6853_00975 [Butyrivibrio sp. X503]